MVNTDEDRCPTVELDAGELQAWFAGTDFAHLPLTEEVPIGHLPLTEDVPIGLLPPPDSPVSVLRAVRLPFELDQALRCVAEARAVTISTLIRDWITAGVAGDLDATPDPVVELRLNLAATSRALDKLTGRTATGACGGAVAGRPVSGPDR